MAPELESPEVVLARVDERLKNIEKNLESMNQANSQRKCAENTTRIDAIERMVNGALVWTACSGLMAIASILFSYFSKK